MDSYSCVATMLQYIMDSIPTGRREYDERIEIKFLQESFALCGPEGTLYFVAL